MANHSFSHCSNCQKKTVEEGGSTAGQPRDPDLLLFVPREVSLIPVGLGPSQAWKRAISANCSLTFPTAGNLLAGKTSL